MIQIEVSGIAGWVGMVIALIGNFVALAHWSGRLVQKIADIETKHGEEIARAHQRITAIEARERPCEYAKELGAAVGSLQDRITAQIATLIADVRWLKDAWTTRRREQEAEA